MNFSDHIIREKLDVVFIKSSEKKFETRDEHNSLLWEIEAHNIDYDKANKSPVHLYSLPARGVKIGEEIYDNKANFIAYRVD